MAPTSPLIDDQPRPGGDTFFFSPRVHPGEGGFHSYGGMDTAETQTKAVFNRDRLRVMTGSTVFAFYQDNLLGIRRDHDLVKTPGQNGLW